MQHTNNLDYPRLRHCTMIGDPTGTTLTLVVGAEHFTLDVEEGSVKNFLTIKRYFDGRHSISEIAEISCLSEADIRSVVATFDSMGLLRTAPFDSEIEVFQYINQIDETARMWSRQIGYHRLFRDMNTNVLPRDVFIGFLIETWQYVRMTPIHVNSAIRACSNPRWRSILESYLEEETGHDKLLEQGLSALGVFSKEINSAHPIIGTRSLINMLSEIGSRNTLSYLTCTSLFEASAIDADDAEADFRRLAVTYDVSEKVINPFIRHLRIDIAAGHQNLLATALQDCRALTIENANIAINDMHDVKHAFDQHHDQIIQYYADISNYIPRVKVDWFSL
jgi:pyrroloquinoline quinone (PQQ) biosynthesis protein C